MASSVGTMTFFTTNEDLCAGTKVCGTRFGTRLSPHVLQNRFDSRLSHRMHALGRWLAQSSDC